MAFIIAGCEPYSHSTFVESFHSVHGTVESAKEYKFPERTDYEIYFIYQFDGTEKPIYISAIVTGDVFARHYGCVSHVWADYGTKEWDAMFRAIGSFHDIKDTYIEQTE